MGKPVLVMLSVSLLCILAACENDTSPDVSSQGPSASTPGPAAATAPATPSGTISALTAPAETAVKSELCSLDAINGTGASNAMFNASVGQNMTFEGWAATPDKHAPGNISIILDGPTDFQISGSTGMARTDVATAYGPGVASAGFKVPVAALNVPAGTYAVLIAGTGFTCNTKTSLIVK